MKRMTYWRIDYLPSNGSDWTHHSRYLAKAYAEADFERFVDEQPTWKFRLTEVRFDGDAPPFGTREVLREERRDDATALGLAYDRMAARD